MAVATRALGRQEGVGASAGRRSAPGARRAPRPRCAAPALPRPASPRPCAGRAAPAAGAAPWQRAHPAPRPPPTGAPERAGRGAAMDAAPGTPPAPAPRGGGGAAAAAAASHLPLLDLPPGLVAAFIVPRLRPRHAAALSLSCKAMRAAVRTTVRALTLPGGHCCPAVRYDLAAAFPGVTAVTLTPSNLHEAMNVMPTLLMTVRRAGPGGALGAGSVRGPQEGTAARAEAPPERWPPSSRPTLSPPQRGAPPCPPPPPPPQTGQALPGLSRVALHDKLPDEPSERRKCRSCNAWRNTYDLAAIVFTVHGCLTGRLREFDFATHYISNAECLAIGNMTGAAGAAASAVGGAPGALLLLTGAVSRGGRPPSPRTARFTCSLSLKPSPPHTPRTPLPPPAPQASRRCAAAARMASAPAASRRWRGSPTCGASSSPTPPARGPRRTPRRSRA
jgi:hypothetical protein